MGVIPGPQKPKDADSCAYTLILELLEFLCGIATFDAEQNELFVLHVYLVAVFRDILAISMIMCMKGHNAIFEVFTLPPFSSQTLSDLTYSECQIFGSGTAGIVQQLSGACLLDW